MAATIGKSAVAAAGGDGLEGSDEATETGLLEARKLLLEQGRGLGQVVGEQGLGHRLDVGSTACYSRNMTETITQRELRNESGEIMRRLDRGESFVVTRNGAPVGELTPLRRHRFVTAVSAVATFKNAPAIDPDRFRADLDGWASQDLTPRV